MRLMRYTIVVLYPQRLWLIGPIAYTALVTITDHQTLGEAVARGEKEAWKAQPPEERGKLDEWKVVAAFHGHHDVLTG